MANSFDANDTFSSLYLDLAGSDKSSFELEIANSADHAGYAPKPLEVHLIGNLASGWQIVKFLSLTIDEDPNGNYISDNEFHVYGYGRTKAEAMEDYGNSLIEYYQILAAKDDGPTQALLSRLQSFLLPTS